MPDPDSGTPPAIEAPNGGKAVVPPVAPVTPASPVATLEETIQKAIQPLVQKMSDLEARTGQPSTPPPAGAPASEVQKEITLRREQLSMLRRGEIPAHFEGEILSKLANAEARAVGGEITDHENGKNAFLQNWNASLQQAYQEFPELKDQNSEIFKEAKAIVEKDPGYRKYLEVVSSKSGEKKFDWAALDPRVNLRAAREAYAIVSKREEGKPKVPANRAKGALEGGSTPPPQPASSELNKLEEDAVNTGDPMAWRRYIKARDAASKA